MQRSGGVGGGAQSELMFRLLRLFHVTVSIFLALTDRPINLIYRVSPHPLTSSTGLPSNNELPSSGTVDALCFQLCVPCRGLPQIIQAGCVRASEHCNLSGSVIRKLHVEPPQRPLRHLLAPWLTDLLFPSWSSWSVDPR